MATKVLSHRTSVLSLFSACPPDFELLPGPLKCYLCHQIMNFGNTLYVLGYRQKFDAKSCQNEEKIQICSVKKLEGEEKK